MKVVSSWLRVRRDPRLGLGSESKIPEAAVKTLYRKELRSFFKVICPLHFFYSFFLNSDIQSLPRWNFIVLDFGAKGGWWDSLAELFQDKAMKFGFEVFGSFLPAGKHEIEFESGRYQVETVMLDDIDPFLFSSARHIAEDVE